MKLVVGLDVPETDRGAARFAAWLRESTDQRTELVGVHILARPGYELDSTIERLRCDVEAHARRALAAAGVDEAFAGVTAAFGERAEDGLVEALEREDATALVIGRRAPANKRRLVALGRVARRVLRHLAVPTIVVPPDFVCAGAGPILLATDLRALSDAAAAFASRLAGELSRSLLVAHVIENPFPFPQQTTPENFAEVMERLRGDAERELERWSRARHLGDVSSTVLIADVSLGLAELADSVDSPLIVTGSRRLSAAARIFTASVGSTLPGVAARPVAIVPSDYRRESPVAVKVS